MLFRPCIRERERVLTVYTIAACDVQSSSAIIVTVTTTATPTGIIIIVTIMFVLIIDEFLWRMRISRKLSVLFKIVQVAVILSSPILHVIRIRVILGDIQVPFSIYSLPTPASSVFLYFIPVCSVPVKHLRLLRIPGVLLLLLLRLFLMMVLLLKCFMKQMMLVSLQLLLQLLLLPYRLLSL